MVAVASNVEPLIMKVQDVADALQVSTRHVYRMVDGGLLPRPLKRNRRGSRAPAVIVRVIHKKRPLSFADNERLKWSGRESNPRPLHCEGPGSLSDESNRQQVATSDSPACSAACRNLSGSLDDLAKVVASWPLLDERIKGAKLEMIERPSDAACWIKVNSS